MSKEYAKYINNMNSKSRFTAKTMPPDVYNMLSQRAKQVVCDVVAWGQDIIPRGMKPGFVKPQGSAYRELIDQQLANLRFDETATIPANSYECHEIRKISRHYGYSFGMERNGKTCTAYVTRTH